MTPTSPELRQFVIEFFSDEELETLCFDYFREVHQNFTIGMTKNRKAILLIDYCESRDSLEHLRAALARARPATWSRQFNAPPKEAIRPNPSTTMLQRDPRRIFLSHATADAEFAHKLAGDLRAVGWQVWFAPESIRPGEKWVEAIDRGLETSGVFVVVLTPATVASRWVNIETDAAVEMQLEGLITFIPLEVIVCQPKRLWRQYQYVPFRGSYRVGLDALLRRLEEHLLPTSLPQTEQASAPRAPQSHSNPSSPSKSATPGEPRVKEEQWRQLQALAREIAAQMGKQSGHDELREVYRRFNQHFGLTEYKKLPQRRFDDGVTFLTAWRDEIKASPVKPFRRNRSVSPELDAVTVQQTVSTLLDRLIHENTGIELIRIPAGPFLYGDKKREIELPEYWIGRHPITNAQYKRFVDVTGHDAPQHWHSGNPPLHKLNHPVVFISWHDAQAFCGWAGLALPTEEEWEKAARGSDGRIYPWGNDAPTAEHGNFNRTTSDTTPVGRYSPRGDSPYGCADMAGNVWEWAATADGARRVLRGGSWDDLQDLARAAFRANFFPGIRDNNVGFRLVRRPPSQAL